MKTREFKRKAEELGYHLIETPFGSSLLMDKGEMYTYASVSNKEPLSIDTDRGRFKELPESDRVKLFLLLAAYTSTPIDEREEEKRYRLKLNVPQVSLDEDEAYLNRERSGDHYFLSSLKQDESFQTIFTESELKNLDETGFVREEVTD